MWGIFRLLASVRLIILILATFNLVQGLHTAMPFMQWVVRLR